MNYFKLLSTSALLAILSIQSISATVYEDAEDKERDGWIVYDNKPAGATIANIMDNELNSRVIKFTGNGRANSYMMGAKSGADAWQNHAEKTLHWSMKINEKYKIYVNIETEKGARYLYYSYYAKDKGFISRKYIQFGLGSASMDGNWHNYTRDLEADLQKFEKDNSIIAVNGIIIKGSASIDNLKLTGEDNNVPAKMVINRKITTQSDTAEEYHGHVNLTSSDLELIQDGRKSQTVALRFSSLNIPKNTNITKAYIQFVADEKNSEATSLVIHGEKVNSAKTFTTRTNNVSSRVKTSASASWSPSAWSVVGRKGVAERTTNLKSIVQELVNQDEWSSGNAMAFIIEGRGKRVAKSYNAKENLSPILHIEYGEDGGGEGEDVTAPVITLNGGSSVTVVQNKEYVEQGAVAIDDRDGKVYVDISGEVDTKVKGFYTVFYEASDESGNLATLKREVEVVSKPVNNNNFLNVPSDYATIAKAVSNAKDGDTIILDSGTYKISDTINVHQKNLTIASKYHSTGDKSYIDSTIIEGSVPKSQIRFVEGKAENLKLIGVTGKNFGKFIVFNKGNGNLVDHCKMINIDGDSVSFDSTAGGKVLHSTIDYSGDDAIDVDSKVQGEFEFAYNTILHSHDDGMEIHLWRDKHNDIVKTMTFNIHDNVINLSHKDGIQLIDFSDTTNRTFTISNNTFNKNGHVAIGAIFEKTNHSLPETNFSGTSMKESVKILNNKFDENKYHILGGDNMEVRGNSFKNASKGAIKRVKGKSVIENNTFSNNKQDRIDSN